MTADNYFRRLLARALKNFRFYGARFLEARHQKILLLPFENFIAGELTGLRNTFWNDSLSNDFSNTLARHLGALRERQIPKRQSSYNRTYLKDNVENYFEYGHEQHGLAGTGIPPHRVACEMNSIFRFGIRYNNRRHFNVSKERQSVSGLFTDCHEVKRYTSSCTHVNMFPNGFH